MNSNTKHLLLQTRMIKLFGFLNIDIDDESLKGTFYANERELPSYYYVSNQNNIIMNLQFQR